MDGKPDEQTCILTRIQYLVKDQNITAFPFRFIVGI